MLKFITGRPLWVNLLASIVILLLLLMIFLGSLSLITHHGKVLKIPAVTGQSLDNAKKILEQQGFEVIIQDSTYSDSIPPLQVVKQVPEADNLVKVNRSVYLIINRSVPPFISMPNLVSMTFRNAEMTLRQYGLKIKDTIFKPDFARNSVLDQQVNGETIKPGTKIQQGSGITLVLGNGVGSMEFAVPDLVGLTYREALALLEADGLIPGAAIPKDDVRDTASAFVYEQRPPRSDGAGKINTIRQGQVVDLFLSVEKPEHRADTTKLQPAPNSFQ